MTADDFDKRLRAIYDAATKQVVEVMERARTENADGIAGYDPLDFIGGGGGQDWGRTADAFVCLGGWIYDRAAGKHLQDKRTMTKKLRKVLGYTYP